MKPIPFWVKSFVLAITTVVLVWTITSTITIHFNRTRSSPYYAFVCIKGLSAQKGDYVSIEDHSTKYFEKLHFTKRLISTSGDPIEILNKKVWVDGILVGSPLKKTKEGMPLSTITSSQIPDHYVFVAGDHPCSFDSRYQEFGLVRQENIKGRCFGLIKRVETDI